MFPRDRSPEFDGILEDLPHRLFSPTDLILVPFIRQNGWVKVPVAHVTKRPDLHLVPNPDLLDTRDHPGQFTPWDGYILQENRRCEPCQCTECRPPCGCQLLGLLLRRGNLHFPGALLNRNGLDPRGLLRHLCRVPVHLDQQQGLHVQRQTDLGEILHARQSRSVQELQRAWDDLAVDNGGDRLCCCAHRVELRQHRLFGLGWWHQLECDLRDNTQRALGPDEQVLERETRDVLHAFCACLQDLSVRHHHLQRHHVVSRHAVFQSAKPARIVRHISADRGDLDGPRVGRIEEARFHRGVKDILRQHARLDRHRQVFPVDFQDPVHANQAHHNRAWRRYGSAAQARARSPCHHRHLVEGGQLQQPRHLVNRLGQYHAFRHTVEQRGTVVPVHAAVFTTDHDLVVAKKLAQFREINQAHSNSLPSLLNCVLCTSIQRDAGSGCKAHFPSAFRAFPNPVVGRQAYLPYIPLPRAGEGGRPKADRVRARNPHFPRVPPLHRPVLSEVPLPPPHPASRHPARTPRRPCLPRSQSRPCGR